MAGSRLAHAAGDRPRAVEPGRLRRTAALDGEADIAKRCYNGRIMGTVIFCGAEGAVHSCKE
jgi:hypothetical protein